MSGGGHRGWDAYEDTRSQGGRDWRRDDGEYQADWKRRKTDEGNYRSDEYWPHDAYDNYQDSGQYSGHDDLSHSAARGGMRDEFGHRRARTHPSEPSQHIIFLGLDVDYTEADLQGFLTGCGFAIDSVTIIRDRSTGLSKQFGFAQFTNVTEAQRFLEPNFPFIQLPPPQIILTPLDEDRSKRVKIDFSQSANPATSGKGSRPGGPPEAANDGTRDIGSAHVPVMLLRGLDGTATPEGIAEALRSSGGIGKKAATGMRRVVLIKDKASRISKGFAFVEFTDTKAASMVLANTMSPTLHPSGFRIGSHPVAASFAHPNSFQLLPADATRERDDALIDATTAVGGRDTGLARYWDERTTVGELTFEVEEGDSGAASHSTTKKKEKKKEKEKAKEPLGLPIPTALSDNLAPVKLGFKTKGVIKPIASTSVAVGLGFGTDDTDDATPQAETQQDKTSTYIRVAPMAASKRVANNINKWNTVQRADQAVAVVAEANALPIVSSDAPLASTSSPVSAMPSRSPSATPVASTSQQPQEQEFEYGDAKKLSCLLCSRQFKTIDQLRRHNGESDLHKKNLSDIKLCDIARDKARVAHEANSTATSEPTVPKYRDRAQERRALFGQPDVPAPESSTPATGSKRRYAEGPRAPTPPPPPPPPAKNPGEDETNVGNRLLQKMGWSKGAGLGLSGEGRVAPIATAIYAQGAGLGASKGKEIGAQALNDTFVYTDSVRASARERFAKE